MNGNQDLLDIISGKGAVRVSVELATQTIVMIFVAFLLSAIVSRLLIK